MSHSRAPRAFALLVCLAAATTAGAATITVVSNAASGPGSLYEAVIIANTTPEADTIGFAIGSGPVTIDDTTLDIRGPVTIDGTTQPGYAGVPLVRLRGGNGNATIVINAGPATIRALQIDGARIPVEIRANDNRIAGSYIGTDGTSSLYQGGTDQAHCIAVYGSNNIIGGTTAADRNVIAGCTVEINIHAGASNNTIAGNHINVNAAGTAAIARQFAVGVSIEPGGDGNVVGGSDPGARNLIVGETSAAVTASGTNLRVEGNYLGVDITGLRALPNGWGVATDGPGAIIRNNTIATNYADGVRVAGKNIVVQGNRIGVGIDGITPLGVFLGVGVFPALTAPRNVPEHDGNIIGGTAPGEANVIGYATWYGVGVSSRSTGNRISGNSIHHNASVGIDLQTGLPQDFVTPNDSGDTDSGANKLQNFPVLTALSQSGGSILVDGTLNAAPSQTYTIELFTSDACHQRGHGEGQTYLGSTTVTTDGTNLGTFRVTLPAGSPMPRVLTATATDADGNTSEFSRCFAPAGFVRFLTTTGTATEGGSVSLTIARSGALDGPLTARYTTRGGTATSGTDFVAADGTVTFPAGVSEATITLTTLDDSAAEPGETFVVTVTGETPGSGAEQPAEATVTINDSGDAAVPNLLVTNTNDSGPGSLRQAILDSEVRPGMDVIGFAIGSGPQSIQIVSDLPEIQDVVVIDATTQPGFAGKPIVELRGPESGFALTGFRIASGGAVIRGFAINRLSTFIVIRGGNGHVIAGNWFGLNLDGNTAAAAASSGTFPTLLHNNGVVVAAGAGTRIGGTAAADGNVFVALGTGIFTDRPPVGTVIQGNSFGLNAAGDGVVGIHTPIITNSAVLFGGTEPGAGNVVAAGTFSAVFGGSGSLVQGNLFGIDRAGTARGPVTSAAVWIYGRDILFGGATAAARNVIAGSRWGIELSSGAQNNTVQGNFIGTDATGTRAVPISGSGVLVQHSSDDPPTIDNRIIGNVIAGSGTAIEIRRDVQRTTILGNRIGVGSDGVTPLPNGGGIAIAPSSFDNVIGDVTPGAGNIIANSVYAVLARDTRTTVRGNSIYANATGIQSATFLPPGPVSAQSARGRTTVSGTFSTSGAGHARNVQIDFYANPDCSGRPEGKTYLGTVDAPVAAFQSSGSYNAVLPVRASGGITATVTDPATKTTTDFSPCTVIYTPGEVRFSAAAYDVRERDGSVTLTIERHDGATGSGSVRFSLIDGTARAGSDYLPAENEVVSFGDGETSKTITVRIVRDNAGEGGEEFYVQLHPSTNLAIGEPSRATVRVSEELPSINVSDARFDEGNDGPRTIRIPVRLSVSSTSAVTVRYRLLGGTATDGADFLDGGGTVTFAPGETRASIPVTVIGDSAPEPLETFSVVLHSPTRGVIERGVAEIGILNDDPHFTAFRDLVYSETNGRALALDLYVPVGEGPFPLVVWIHGDDWATGSKTFTPALRLAERGYAVASIDYRLSGESVFPAQLHDAREALRWLRAHAAEYRLAPNQVAAWGSGAGGHLAALLGTTADTDVAGDPAGDPNAIRVQAVVTWYAPTDLVALAASAPCDAARDLFTAPERALLGCVVESCPATARAASPLTYVSRGDAPALVMHGAMDCVVPVAQAEAFARALQAAEVSATLVILPNAMHGGSEWGSAQALAEVDAFLDRTLRPPSMTVP